MAENTPDNAKSGPSPEQPAKKKRSLGKKILIALGVIIVLVVVLVVLLPTIAGMGFVRNIVVGKINDNLNGKATIDDWSLGWFGGVDVNNLSVADASGAKVVELKKLHTDMGLWNAIRGNYDLGKVTVEGLRLNIVKNEDGTTNLSKLARSQPKEATPAEEKKAKGESKLPDIRGTVVLTDCLATVSGAGVPEPVAAAFGGQVQIPDINQTITDTLNAALTIGGQAAGKVAVDGTLDVIQNNQVDMKTASLKQKLGLEGVQLASVAAFLPKEQVSKLQGVTDGQVTAELSKGTSAQLQGQITTKNVAVSTAAMKNGETFESDQVAVTIPATAVAMAKGMDDWHAYRVRTGGDNSAPITIALGKSPKGEDLGAVQLTMDATPQALLNATAGKAPGEAGKLVAGEKLNVAALARMMPKTMGLIEGVQLDQATLSEQTTVALTPQQGQIQAVTDLSQITGTNTATKQPITIKPIHLDASATAGGTGSLSAADFKDIALNLTSGFANAKFTGQSIADVSGQAHADLKAMRDELGQVVDFGALQLAGVLDATLSSSGNLAAEGGQGKVQSNVTLRDLKVAGLSDGKTVDQKRIDLGLVATLVRGKQKAIETIKDAVLTAKTGDEQNPTIDVSAGANINMAGESPTVGFSLQKFFVDAARAQSEFAAFVPGDYKVASGTISATGSGTWSNKKLDLQGFNAQQQNLTVALVGKDGKSTPVVQSLTMNEAMAGTVATGNQMAINLTQLNVSEQQNRLTVQKVGDGPLALTVGGGAFSGQGKVQMGADLAFVNSLVKAFSGGTAEVVAKGKGGEVRSGTLNGTLAFDTAAKQPTKVNGDFKVANLVVTTPDGQLQPQEIALALQAATNADQTALTAQQVSVKSGFANLDVTDTQVQLKNADGSKPATWDMLQKANVNVNVTDVGALYAIANAFMPAAAPAAGAAPAASGFQRPTVNLTADQRQAIANALPADRQAIGSQVISAVAPEQSAADQLAGPLSVSGGHIAAKLAIARQSGVTTVNLSDLSGGDIQLRRGQTAYAVKPFSMQASAALNTSGATINQIDVSQLAGKLGIADLSLDQPISIKSPGTEQMSATGGIKLAGQLHDASDLLGVLQGKPLPYNGAYVLVQKLQTQGTAVGVNGTIDLTGFQVLDGQGKVQVAEDKIAVTDDLKLDQKAKSVAGNLTVDSKTIGVKFNGGVQQYDTNRAINDGTTLAVAYDAAKVWQMLKPMLSPETQQKYADLQIAGVKQTSFKLGGSYPANVPYQQAVKTLTASGALPIDSLSTQGITAQNIDPGFTLSGGKLTVTAGTGSYKNAAAAPAPGTAPTAAGTPAPSASAPPAVVTAMVNGGTIDLTGAVVDLTTPDPRLSMPANKAVAHNVALNQVLAKYANKVIPVFDQNSQTAIADVTMVRCENLPLGANMNKPGNGGYAEILLSLSRVKVGGPIIGGIDQFTGGAFTQSAQASVEPTRIVISDGQAQINNFALAFGQGGKQWLRMNGSVSLADNGPLNLTANLPPDLIKRFGREVLQYLPQGVDLPIGGTKEKPEFAAADKVIASLAKQALTNLATGALTGQKGGKQGGNELGNILGNVLGGQQQQQQQPPQQPAQGQQPQQQQQAPQGQQQPGNELGNILGNVLGGQQQQQQQQQPQQRQEQQSPPPQGGQQPPAQNAAPGQQQQPQAQQPAEDLGNVIGDLFGGGKSKAKAKPAEKPIKATTRPTSQPVKQAPKKKR